MDRVFGDEDLTKEEYDRRVESSIKNYEKSIKQWEEEVMPSVKNNERYVKMYQEYLKEHPNTEKTLVEFAKEMRNKLKK